MDSKKRISIIPTVLANEKKDFNKRLLKLLPISKELQIDFMDGQFVPSTGIPLKDIPALNKWPKHRFEAHLMVYHPEKWIPDARKKGFKKIIFHYEAVEDKNIEQIAMQIRELKMVPVLAINPETPIRRILKHIKHVDGILLLGVHPGFNGAPYVKETKSRVKELSKHKKPGDKWFIQVDGGMDPEHAKDVAIAGATKINSGSYVGNAIDPKLALNNLKDAVKE